MEIYGREKHDWNALFGYIRDQIIEQHPEEGSLVTYKMRSGDIRTATFMGNHIIRHRHCFKVRR